jgi:tRNA(Ile)-lysidine synthase
MKVTGEDRTTWPVVEIEGRILWMRGVELEPDPAIQITVEPISARSAPDAPSASPTSPDLSR